MKRTYLIFCFALLPAFLMSQFYDDFSDGNFTNNPEWTGETEKFIVNENNELQLYDEAQTLKAYLITESSASESASWEFYARTDFEATGGSNINVYLMSDNEDLSGSLNGYFLNVGNDKRNVSLFKQTGTTKTAIIEGPTDRYRGININSRFLITRDDAGNWEVYSDSLGGRNYILEGSVNDDTHTSSDFFGVLCNYSATRWNQIYFDDFVVTDNSVLPEIIDIEIIGNNALKLLFNKPMDQSSAQNAQNYSINNNIGTPTSAQLDNTPGTTLMLEFANDFQNGVTYTLSFQNVMDLDGNISQQGSVNFYYFMPEFGMVVVNEIMRDATPSQGLPESNYFELYNTTDFEIDITGWKYRIGTFTRTLPSHTMQPGEYLVMCEDDYVSEFNQLFSDQSLDNAVAMSFYPASFPAMNNAGQIITIYDYNQMPIDSVRYSETWYDETWKRGGGWSLEKIDPLNLCSTFENWTASTAPLGGTPGGLNSVDAPNIDTVPPYIEKAFVSDPTTSLGQITITYSQDVIFDDAINKSNYEILPDYGEPMDISQSSSDSRSFILQLPYELTPNVEYSISIQNITDYCGNILVDTTIKLIVFYPEPYDVVITEIMANANPVVQLPDAEYIEVYNRTDYDLNLMAWKFTSGSTTRSLPYGIVKANSYAILCHENNAHLFEEYGTVIGVPTFPSLTNTSGTLSLQHYNNEYIHTVSYSNTWFKEDFKRSGGWSLEMIDFNNPCGEGDNWRGSKDVRGGTPGQENSVKDENPDISVPYPFAAEATKPNTLTVWFNEILQKEEAENKDNYYVEEYGNPVSVSAKPPRFSEITMEFDGEFTQGKVYYLNITDDVVNCSGIGVEANTEIRFGLADSVTKDDIIFNEMLFNTRFTGGSRYIELYNNSDKLLDLKLLWLGNRNDEGDIVNANPIADKSRLVLPGEYCALNMDNEDIKNNYFVKDPDALFEVSGFPSMRNSDGHLVITDRFMNVIDEVKYNENQHYRLISDVAGVALERVNYDRPSHDPNNWFSAAQDAGFGTPGYKNSQFTENEEVKDVIKVHPEVFSPNNDGFDDFLNIAYKFEEPGFSMTVAIYNANGRLVKYIAQNELVGTEGHFYWDGFDLNDNLSPMGIYVVYAEMFNLDGERKIEKHAFVLSKRVY